MDGRDKVGIFYDMGKDIDRNITRQLWERLKNTFTRNDVIPVENGGTGENNLESFYPKLVSDKRLVTFKIKDTHLLPGFTLQSDSNAEFQINKKSMYIEGRIHVKKNVISESNTFLKIALPNLNGYSIEKIKISPYATSMTIDNNILYLTGYFNTNNEYNNVLYSFIPFI